MTWSVRRGVRVWTGEFPEIPDKDLATYRFCAIPIEERQRPSTVWPVDEQAVPA